MIWIIILSSALGFLFLFLLILSIGIDSRFVVNIDENICVVELRILRFIRVLRLNAMLLDNEIYIKFFNKPYRKLAWLVHKDDLNKNKKEIIKLDKFPQLYASRVNINIMLGLEKADLATFVWGGIGILLGNLQEIINEWIVVEHYAACYKPMYVENKLLIDIKIRIRQGAIGLGYAIFRGVSAARKQNAISQQKN